VKVKKRKEGNCIFIIFEHKKLAQYLNSILKFPFGKKGEISINKKIVNKRKYLKTTLRGIFDTDGCIYFTKNNSNKRYYPIIEMSTHSNALLNQLKDILMSFGLNVKIIHFNDSVKLHGKENLIKFMQLVGSNHPDKISKFIHWKKFGYCPRIDELD
jgi:DNA-binding transcriptional regulator WhiA